MISKTDKTLTELFDMKNDPECSNNISEGNADTVERMWRLIEEDAGGEVPIIDVSFPMIDMKKKV